MAVDATWINVPCEKQDGGAQGRNLATNTKSRPTRIGARRQQTVLESQTSISPRQVRQICYVVNKCFEHKLFWEDVVVPKDLWFIFEEPASLTPCWGKPPYASYIGSRSSLFLLHTTCTGNN